MVDVHSTSLRERQREGNGRMPRAADTPLLFDQ